MTDQRIDVAALPVLRISHDTFEALTEFPEGQRPTEQNGATWKVRLTRVADAPYVICRYVGLKDSPGCRIEMLRPKVSASLGAKWHPTMGKAKR